MLGAVIVAVATVMAVFAFEAGVLAGAVLDVLAVLRWSVCLCAGYIGCIVV